MFGELICSVVQLQCGTRSNVGTRQNYNVLDIVLAACTSFTDVIRSDKTRFTMSCSKNVTRRTRASSYFNHEFINLFVFSTGPSTKLTMSMVQSVMTSTRRWVMQQQLLSSPPALPPSPTDSSTSSLPSIESIITEDGLQSFNFIFMPEPSSSFTDSVSLPSLDSPTPTSALSECDGLSDDEDLVSVTEIIKPTHVLLLCHECGKYYEDDCDDDDETSDTTDEKNMCVCCVKNKKAH